MSEKTLPSIADVREGPLVMSVPQAGRVWGWSDRRSYKLAQTGKFPVRVLGGDGMRKYVLKSDLLAHLEGTR